jgi:hypothetical protein
MNLMSFCFTLCVWFFLLCLCVCAEHSTKTGQGYHLFAYLFVLNCYDVNVKGPPEAHMFNAWFVDDGTSLERSGNFRSWGLV